MLLCVVRLVRSKSEWGRGWDMMTQPGIPQLGRITSLNSDLLQQHMRNRLRWISVHPGCASGSLVFPLNFLLPNNRNVQSLPFSL